MSPYLEGGITYGLSGLKISDIIVLAPIAIDNQPTALTITGMSARMSSTIVGLDEILAETIESLLDPFPQ